MVKNHMPFLNRKTSLFCMQLSFSMLMSCYSIQRVIMLLRVYQNDKYLK